MKSNAQWNHWPEQLLFHFHGNQSLSIIMILDKYDVRTVRCSSVRRCDVYSVSSSQCIIHSLFAIECCSCWRRCQTWVRHIFWRTDTDITTYYLRTFATHSAFFIFIRKMRIHKFGNYNEVRMYFDTSASGRVENNAYFFPSVFHWEVTMRKCEKSNFQLGAAE